MQEKGDNSGINMWVEIIKILLCVLLLWVLVIAGNGNGNILGKNNK